MTSEPEDILNIRIASEPTDVLNIRIVFWIFLIFLILLVLVLIFLVNVSVALWAHLGRANPLSASTNAEIKHF